MWYLEKSDGAAHRSVTLSRGRVNAVCGVQFTAAGKATDQEVSRERKCSGCTGSDPVQGRG